MKSAGKPVFDASAALALLLGEPGCEDLAHVQRGAAINSVNAAEVLAKLVSRGMPRGQALIALEALHLEVMPFDAELAARSAEFVRKHVSLGDRCFLASCCRAGHGWTSDRDLPKLTGRSCPPLTIFR